MRILVAYDGSPFSEAAVEEVCDRPWPEGTEVLLLTVDRRLDRHFLRSSHSALDEIVANQRAESAARLSDAASRIQSCNSGLSVQRRVREGYAEEVILEEAHEWQANLIMVGSHGYGPMSRLFLGSVSLAVAASAECSVEIVRKPANELEDAA